MICDYISEPEPNEWIDNILEPLQYMGALVGCAELKKRIVMDLSRYPNSVCNRFNIMVFYDSYDLIIRIARVMGTVVVSRIAKIIIKSN